MATKVYYFPTMYYVYVSNTKYDASWSEWTPGTYIFSHNKNTIILGETFKLPEDATNLFAYSISVVQPPADSSYYNYPYLGGFSRIDTSECKNMTGLFKGIWVYSLNLSGWDVSKVESFDSMFEDATPVKYIYTNDDADWLVDSNRATSNRMFFNCTDLQNYTGLDVTKNRANTVLDYGYFTGNGKRSSWKDYEIYLKENGRWYAQKLFLKDSPTSWTDLVEVKR